MLAPITGISSFVAFAPSSLVEDSSGNLFGTTAYGGAPNAGTMFELQKGSDTITTVATFNGTNGAYPSGGLVEDSIGNLFGTTEGGGTSGDGTVFELQKGSGIITTLAVFNGANGSYPRSGLVEDSGGNLFGTTTAGGGLNDGTVFVVQHGSGSITTLASFNGTNGSGPDGGVIEDSSGNLFGNAFGGANNDGTVFEVKKGSGTITNLAIFNGANGANPYAGLIEDGSGNLFGTTEQGGASNKGTVFELQKGSGTINILVSFNGTNGANPECNLIEDSSGNLFGTTGDGGASNYGTVFEVQSGSGTITTLGSLSGFGLGTDGAYPEVGLVEDSGGNLFGSTIDGGPPFGQGTVFEVPAPTPPALTVTTPSLPSWTVNQPSYNQTISAAGGTGPSTFAVMSGLLPAGLTLSTGGVLSGTPTIVGIYNFTVTATDTLGASASQNYSITVSPGQFSKYLVAVQGSSTVQAGSSFLVTVQAADQYGNPVTSYSGPATVTAPLARPVAAASQQRWRSTVPVSASSWPRCRRRAPTRLARAPARSRAASTLP